MRRLLIRPGGIGDCILSLPAMEYLRCEETEVWAPSPVLPLIRFANGVKSIASTGLDLLGLPGIDPPSPLLQTLRSFGSIVSWYGANREELRARAAELDLPLQFLPALPGPENRMHCADFFACQTGAPLPAVPRIGCTRVRKAPFAVIHPFSGSPRKNWPLERFREVARAFPLPVRWCAAPEEQLEGAVRFDDLYRLGEWLASAAVFIGNDSGIAHLAAAVGIPVVAIFGPTDPCVWQPRGKRVRVIQGDLGSIPVERVLSEALRCLD